MENKFELVDKICKSPIEMSEIEEYLILSDDMKEILNQRMMNIISFLRKNNPINERKLKILFGQDVHDDLIIMKHFSIINIQEISKDTEEDIITLNKDLRIIN